MEKPSNIQPNCPQGLEFLTELNELNMEKIARGIVKLIIQIN